MLALSRIFHSMRRAEPPLHLEKILGLTAFSNASLAFDSNNNLIAYPAGCMIVLYDVINDSQRHIVSPSRKAVTCVAFSKNGTYIASGEVGKSGRIRVWRVRDKALMEDLPTNGGINCVKFHPTEKYIVSVGPSNVVVWDWANSVIGSKIISHEILDATFFGGGERFVTVGPKYVAFWKIESRKSKPIKLEKKTLHLTIHQDQTFCSVISSQDKTNDKIFCAAKEGSVYIFNSNRKLEGWLSLQASPRCLGISDGHLFVGCDNGLTRVINILTWKLVANMPSPHPLGVDVTASVTVGNPISERGTVHYPDVVAIAINQKDKKLCCIYSDRSLYVWDVRNPKSVNWVESFMFHRSAALSIDAYPIKDVHLQWAPTTDSFVTCSEDNTVRLWSLATDQVVAENLHGNLFIRDLMKIIYVGDESDDDAVDIASSQYEATNRSNFKQQKAALTTVRFSPDGRHVAVGNRSGCIRIYDLKLNMMKTFEERSEASAVLSFDFIKTSLGDNLMSVTHKNGVIRIFDKDKNYELLQYLHGHASHAFSARFLEYGDKIHMASCGADKTFIFYTARKKEKLEFERNGCASESAVFFDMCVDYQSSRYGTACQDRKIRIYHQNTRKQEKVYKGSTSDKGRLIKIALDPTSTYAATLSRDGTTTLLNFQTGQILASLKGQIPRATGIVFLNDGQHLVTTSKDGCLYVWRVSTTYSSDIENRMEKITNTRSGKSQRHGISKDGKTRSMPRNTKLTFHIPNAADTRISFNTFGEDENSSESSYEGFEIVKQKDWEQSEDSEISSEWEEIAICKDCSLSISPGDIHGSNLHEMPLYSDPCWGMRRAASFSVMNDRGRLSSGSSYNQSGSCLVASDNYMRNHRRRKSRDDIVFIHTHPTNDGPLPSLPSIPVDYNLEQSAGFPEISTEIQFSESSFPAT